MTNIHSIGDLVDLKSSSSLVWSVNTSYLLMGSLYRLLPCRSAAAIDDKVTPFWNLGQKSLRKSPKQMRLIKMNCVCGHVFSFCSCSCSLGCGTVWHSRTLFHPHNQQSTGAHPQSVEVKMKTKGGTWHDVGCIVWQGHFTLETVESVLFTVNKNKEVHKNVAETFN